MGKEIEVHRLVRGDEVEIIVSRVVLQTTHVNSKVRIELGNRQIQ